MNIHNEIATILNPPEFKVKKNGKPYAEILVEFAKGFRTSCGKQYRKAKMRESGEIVERLMPDFQALLFLAFLTWPDDLHDFLDEHLFNDTIGEIPMKNCLQPQSQLALP